MKVTRKQNLISIALVSALALVTTVAYAADALPSWNDGPAKKSIVEFVVKVTKEGGSDFVLPDARASCRVPPGGWE